MNSRAISALKQVVRATVPRGVRNSLRSPKRSAQWLWDGALFHASGTRVLTVPPDFSMVCHPRAYRAALDAQINDPDQRAEFAHFLTLCNRELLLFDIGAHFGIFSVAAAVRGGRAVAVEPSPMATDMIAIQAALNQCANKVQIIRAAANGSSGTIALLTSGLFSQGYFQIANGRSKRELTEVPAITIDELTRRFGAPTHLKIDVEGHEAAVVRGATRTLKEHHPVLLLELHNEMVRSAGGDPSELLDEITDAGYEVSSTAGTPIARNDVIREPIIRIVATNVISVAKRV